MVASLLFLVIFDVGTEDGAPYVVSELLDGETLLAVEAGYTIFTDWRRRGYAAEMLAGFIAWAKSQGVAGLVLSIAPGNLASRALAARFGARQIGHVGEQHQLLGLQHFGDLAFGPPAAVHARNANHDPVTVQNLSHLVGQCILSSTSSHA